MSRRKPIKTKKCPRCNTPHSKRGTYCSYSCANVREQTEEIKKRKFKGVKNEDLKNKISRISEYKLTIQKI